HGLVDEGGVVAGLEHRQPKVARLDAALPGLDDAVQERRRGDTLGIRRLARLCPVSIDLLGMRERALARAHDVGFNDLLELRTIQAAGEVVRRLIRPEAQLVWTDQVAVLGACLPEVTDGLCQESENAPSLLEVGDGRGLAIERREQLRMEGIVLNDLSLVLGAGRTLGEVGSLLDHFAEVPDILLPDLFGSLA